MQQLDSLLCHTASKMQEISRPTELHDKNHR